MQVYAAATSWPCARLADRPAGPARCRPPHGQPAIALASISQLSSDSIDLSLADLTPLLLFVFCEGAKNAYAKPFARKVSPKSVAGTPVIYHFWLFHQFLSKTVYKIGLQDPVDC